jgi:hypothetical protein
MAPSITETVHETFLSSSLKGKNALTAIPQTQGHGTPLKLSGALDNVKSFDLTPVIGREFQGVDLAAWLKAPNSDELLRDLAITSEPPNILHAQVIANKNVLSSLTTWSCLLSSSR